jgi:hypothetical protein
LGGEKGRNGDQSDKQNFLKHHFDFHLSFLTKQNCEIRMYACAPMHINVDFTQRAGPVQTDADNQ